MRLRSRNMLSEYIKLLGESERQFAARAGLGHATVNHLLTGRRDQCSSATAEAIEKALGCPPGLLFAAS